MNMYEYILYTTNIYILYVMNGWMCASFKLILIGQPNENAWNVWINTKQECRIEQVKCGPCTYVGLKNKTRNEKWIEYWNELDQRCSNPDQLANISYFYAGNGLRTSKNYKALNENQPFFSACMNVRMFWNNASRFSSTFHRILTHTIPNGANITQSCRYSFTINTIARCIRSHSHIGIDWTTPCHCATKLTFIWQ